MEKMRPSAIPYGLLSVQTALEKQSPSGVGVTKLLSASAMLTAVEAAVDLLHLSVMAPPAVEYIWPL